MKIAAIDVGSNACRLCIREVKQSGKTKKILNLREPLRLGADSFSRGSFSPKMLNQGLNVFKKFKKILKNEDVNFIRALGTSALRDSKNGKAFIRKVYQETGINIELISGLKEASLIVDAVRTEIDISKTSSILIDIGGGSTEVSLVVAGKLTHSTSINVGTVRLLLKTKPKDMKKIVYQIVNKHLEKTFTNFIKTPIGFAVGTGGNVECLARLRRQILKKNIPYFLNFHELRFFEDVLKTMEMKERMERFDMSVDRADVILPACYILEAVLTFFNISLMMIPFVGLRDGIIIDTIRGLKSKNLENQI